MRKLTREEFEMILRMYEPMRERLKILKADLAVMEAVYRDVDPVEVEALHAQSYENADMPRGTLTSDPTARFGTKYADGIKPRYLEDLERDIDSCKTQIRAVERNISMMNGWMSVLDGVGRMVFEKRVLRREKWPVVVSAVNRRYGDGHIEKRLRKDLKHDTEKVYQNAIKERPNRAIYKNRSEKG